MRLIWWILCTVFVRFLARDCGAVLWNVWDVRYWRCILKKVYICPDDEIKFFLYTKETGTKRLRIDVRNDLSLKYSGFDPRKKNVLIIHGFNGTESKSPITILRDGSNDKWGCRIQCTDKDGTALDDGQLLKMTQILRDKLASKDKIALEDDPAPKDGSALEDESASENCPVFFCKLGETPSISTAIFSAYLTRDDYNVFTVDWEPLTRFPCYISALSNTRLIGMCTAQLYARIMDDGGNAKETTCVGHSLGAHICGMVSNHLDVKQHKIVGLDPARPLIDRFANKNFKLTKDDAHQVQIIHTNAGFLGEVNQVGHVDFCVNGGRFQPNCYGNRLRRARCSHFQSACYYAQTVRFGNSIIGRPCTASCPKRNSNWGFLPGKSIPMGEDTPFGIYGTYCVDTNTHKDCPFFQ